MALESCVFLGVTSAYGTSWKVASDTDIHLIFKQVLCSPSGSLHSLVHVHNNFIAHCYTYMKFACIYYNTQLLAASDYDKEQII